MRLSAATSTVSSGLFLVCLILTLYLLLTQREIALTTVKTSLRVPNVLLSDTTDLTPLKLSAFSHRQTMDIEPWRESFSIRRTDADTGDVTYVSKDTVADNEFPSFAYVNSLRLAAWRPVPSLGWTTLTPDARQLFSSLDNQAKGIAQYVYSVNEKKFESKSVLPMHQVPAFAVGSNGCRAIEMSVDGLRLYVAYEVVSPDDDPTTDYPFGRTMGRVDILGRRPDGFTIVNGFPSSNQPTWTYITTLRNTFATTRLRDVSPVTGLAILSDMFGMTMRSTIHPTTRHRVLTVACMQGYEESRGATLFTYEEMGNGAHVIIDTLDIRDRTLTHDFGAVFDHRGAILAVGRSSQNSVEIYERNDTWSLMSVLQSPLPFVKFGHSVELSYDGNRLLVGAPDGNGRVYVYVRDGLTFILKQTIERPVLPDVSGFGAWIRSDPTSRLVFITASGNAGGSVDGAAFLSPSPSYVPEPARTMTGFLGYWNGMRLELFADDVPFRTSTTAIHDYMYGASANLSIQDKKSAVLCVSSPSNRTVDMYELTVDVL